MHNKKGDLSFPEWQALFKLFCTSVSPQPSLHLVCCLLTAPGYLHLIKCVRAMRIIIHYPHMHLKTYNPSLMCITTTSMPRKSVNIKSNHQQEIIYALFLSNLFASCADTGKIKYNMRVKMWLPPGLSPACWWRWVSLQFLNFCLISKTYPNRQDLPQWASTGVEHLYRVLTGKVLPYIDAW